jgi:hypothetical protein
MIINRHGKKLLEWIHPSYRDLVIERLATHAGMRTDFIRRASLQGIRLAVSGSGGETGQRTFPLMATARDWALLEVRVREIAELASISDAVKLLVVFGEALTGSRSKEERERVLRVLRDAFSIVRRRWERGEPTETEHLATYCKQSVILEPLVQLPDFSSAWRKRMDALRGELKKTDVCWLSDHESADDWVTVVQLILENEPRFMKQVNFEEINGEDVEAIIGRFEDEQECEHLRLSARFGCAEESAEVLLKLATVTQKHAHRARSVAGILQERASVWRESYYEDLDLDEPDDEGSDDDLRTDSEFDVDALFADL